MRLNECSPVPPASPDRAWRHQGVRRRGRRASLVSACAHSATEKSMLVEAPQRLSSRVAGLTTMIGAASNAGLPVLPCLFSSRMAGAV